MAYKLRAIRVCRVYGKDVGVGTIFEVSNYKEKNLWLATKKAVDADVSEEPEPRQAEPEPLERKRVRDRDRYRTRRLEAEE